MSESPVAKASEPTRRSAVVAALSRFALVTLVIVPPWGLRFGVWTVPVLLGGYLVIGITAWRYDRPVRYTLTREAITRQDRSTTRDMPLAMITDVRWMSPWRRGDRIEIRASDLTMDIALGEETELLVRNLGSLLQASGTDGTVIRDGVTKHWLGLADAPQRPASDSSTRQMRP